MSKPIDQELLPCPFCGGVPIVSSFPGLNKIYCSNQPVKCGNRSMYQPDEWQARAAVQPAGVVVPDEYTIAEQVRAALDRQACPDAWMVIAYEAVIKALAASPHPVSGEQKSDMADAYVGAMEDRNIWKRRALEAEEKIRTYDRRIVDLGVLSMRTAVEKPAAQDVAGLVEALETAETYVQSKFSRLQARRPDGRKLAPDHPVSIDLAKIQAALAAHRDQQGEQP